MRTGVDYLGKAIQTVITFLLACLLICNLYLIVMGRVLGVENPSVFGYSIAVVASGSMEPTISVNDLIINHIQSSYAEGDIITFQNESSLTTHRIAAITEEGYITKGDANNAADPDVVSEGAVVGRVVKIIPRIGSALFFLKTPPGMILLIFAGLLLIEIPLLLKYEGRDIHKNGSKTGK